MVLSAAIAAGVPLVVAPAAQAQAPRDLTYDITDNPDFVCTGCGVFDSPYYLHEGEASQTAWNGSKNDAIAQATARGINVNNSTYTWTKYKADERAGNSTITVGVQHRWNRDSGGFLRSDWLGLKRISTLPEQRDPPARPAHRTMCRLHDRAERGSSRGWMCAGRLVARRLDQ